MGILDLLRRLRPDPRAHAETVATLIDEAACQRERARRAMADWRETERTLPEPEREPTRNDAMFDLFGRPPALWRETGADRGGD